MPCSPLLTFTLTAVSWASAGVVNAGAVNAKAAAAAAARANILMGSLLVQARGSRGLRRTNAPNGDAFRQICAKCLFCLMNIHSELFQGSTGLESRDHFACPRSEEHTSELQ